MKSVAFVDVDADRLRMAPKVPDNRAVDDKAARLVHVRTDAGARQCTKLVRQIPEAGECQFAATNAMAPRVADEHAASRQQRLDLPFNGGAVVDLQ